jgi:hypothetical protein
VIIAPCVGLRPGERVQPPRSGLVPQDDGGPGGGPPRQGQPRRGDGDVRPPGRRRGRGGARRPSARRHSTVTTDAPGPPGCGARSPANDSCPDATGTLAPRA